MTDREIDISEVLHQIFLLEDVTEELDQRELSENEKIIKNSLIRALNCLTNVSKEFRRWKWDNNKERNWEFARRMRSEAIKAIEQKKSGENEITHLTAELVELTAIRKEHIKQQKIRENNPTAEKAYKNYQIILKLCK